MAASTPLLKQEGMLGALDSRYVDVDDIPWKPTQCEGVQVSTSVPARKLRWARLGADGKPPRVLIAP
mgnify:CR=1 FL=1